MKRFGFALLFLLAAAPAVHATQLPPQLHSSVTLTGDTLHLGDLWDNVGAKAGVVVAAAPQPGRHITVEANWLAAVAAANGVDWHPESAYDRSVVERAGQAVDPALIETELREALNLEGLPADSGFEISNRDSLNVMVATGIQPTVAVHDLVLDPRVHRFTALIEVPAGSPSATRVRIEGRTFTNTRIPVLVRPMARGDTIGEHDIEWKEVREEGVRQDTIIEARQLLGMEPRYQIRAGVPLRLSELERPVVVARNANVTIVLRTPYMTLTALGQAKDDGGMGDIIKVTNLQTKQTVDARVDGPGTVTVTALSPRTMTN